MRPSRSSSVSAPSPFGRAELHAGDEATEVLIAGCRLTEERKRKAADFYYSAGPHPRGCLPRAVALGRIQNRTSPISSLPLPSALCPSSPSHPSDRQLRPNDRTQTGGAGSFVESGRAVHAVAIEQRERGIIERNRAVDECFRKRGALEKTESGRRMQLDIHRMSPNRIHR